MKKTLAALGILAAISVFITAHTVTIHRLSDDVLAIGGRVEQRYRADDWDGVLRETDALWARWEKSRFWACMTVRTGEVKEIEVALNRCRAYAALEDKEEFIGEWILFRMLVEHLPRREGCHINELL